MSKFIATAHNSQGASDQHTSDTKAGINAWLKSWSDPEVLAVTVADDDGKQVGSKPIGRKLIAWAQRLK